MTRRPRLAALAAVAALAATLAQGMPARADSKAEAQALFRSGQAAFEAGQYDTAAQAFEQAYAVLPLPQIAFSTAQAYRLQYVVDKDASHLKRAIDLYRLYLEQMPQGGRREDVIASLAELEPIMGRIEADLNRKVQAQILRATTTQLVVTANVEGAIASIDGTSGAVPLVREVTPGAHAVSVTADGYVTREQQALAVEGRLVPVELKLEAKPAQLTVRADRGARIAVDGRAAGTTPLAAALPLPAGHHFITVSRRGHQAWARDLDVARGQAVTLDAPLPRTRQRTASYVVLGAAGAALLGAGVTSLFALSADGAASDLEDLRQASGLTPDQLTEYQRQLDRRDGWVSTTWAVVGAAGGLAVTGALLWWFDNPEAERAPSASDAAAPEVTPVLGPDLAGVSFSGGF